MASSIRPMSASQEALPFSLVGRAPQLQQLTALLDQAGRGQGRVALVTGAAGMGKTSVVQAIMATAQSRGWVVWSGAGYPNDEPLPGAVVLRSAGPYLRSLPPPARAALLDDLPHLNRLMGRPDLALHERPATSHDVKVPEEVCRVVERITQEQPLLWCIDDLDLADASSLEVFSYLASCIAQWRVLLVATCRSEKPDRLCVPGVQLLAMGRWGRSEEVRLGRLSPADTALLVTRQLGARPARTLLDYLEGGSIGSPGVICSLLSFLESEGLLARVGGAVGLNPAAAYRAPLTAREEILERLLPVAPRQRELLNLLAVMGGTAQLDEVARAAEQEPVTLLPLVAALEEAGLVVAEEEEGQPVQIRLRHPFLREVLYAALPALVRRHFHARAAVALESGAAVPLARLATQYQGSDGVTNPVRALEVILTAAEEAMLAGGPDAVRYYRAALGLVRGGTLTERLPAVLVGLGQALTLNGELGQAREAFAEALACCERQGDDRGAAAMHVHAAYAAFMQSDLAAMEEHVRRGIARLAGERSSPAAAHLHGLLCQAHVLRFDIAAIGQEAAELAQIAEVQSTPLTRAWFLLTRFWTELLSGQVEPALTTSADALAEAWRSSDYTLIPIAATTRALILLLRGDHAQAAAMLRKTLAAIPLGYRAITYHAVGSTLAMAEVLGGHWEAALQVSDDSVPLEEFMQGLPRTTLGSRAVILIRQGNLEQAAGCLQEAARYPRPFLTEFDYAEALLHLLRGEWTQAAEGAARLYTWSLSPLGIALLAEAQAALGDADGARNGANYLMAMGQLGLPLFAALGAWAGALADRTTGDAAAAMAAFADAARQFDDLAMPFEGARARFEQAQLLAQTDRRAAAALGRKALQIFTRLGSAHWVDRVHRWQAGQAPLRPAAKARPASAFSQRELEILRLADEGLTTAEIAGRLVLSPRTVANHLDRMYSRHGVRNRVGLLRFAREGGFL